MVLGDVNIRIHHGGEFILKDCNRYYEGGKVDFIYNVSLDTLCVDGCREMVEKKFGYKDCKLYWHNGGDSLNSCQLMWNLDSINDMIDSEEDDSDADYSGNESDKDEEFNEIVEKKKLISKSKKNPKVDENQAREDDFNAQLSTKNKAPKIKKEVDLSKNADWESDHDSDSFRMPSKQSSDSSDYEEESSKSVTKTKGSVYITFNPKTPMKYIEFQPGLLFFSVTVLKHAIIDYAVEHKRDIWFAKNDLQRVQAKCKETCSWYLYASKIDVDGTFQVKSYNKDHSCILVNKHSFVRSDWIARKFGSQMRSNPKWKLREIQQHINEVHGLLLSKNQCWLAKKIAMSEIEGEIAKQYKRLYDYGDNGFGYTLMTDQQKGLKNAIDNLLPRAEHRTEPRYWSRAFFDTMTACDMVDNNLSECFNSWIFEARYKPIIELLDDIRLKLMERLHIKRDLMLNTDSRICPQIIKKLKFSIEATKFCKSTWTGADECEVRDIDGGQWVVNMTRKTCSCRR
ncbi:hypothetical protein POM88_018170 [Heracleum sosnowskyi]|uniref:Transposase MuDR plant domain-containing protein n=1 Tax=Heracleum sosnowskyi TaxID=360622 RepID=A0AAD8IQ14_9APIA|nr:hypothetical protein POM88_018170 [Heracleum sosnowskyi]